MPVDDIKRLAVKIELPSLTERNSPGNRYVFLKDSEIPKAPVGRRRVAEREWKRGRESPRVDPTISVRIEAANTDIYLRILARDDIRPLGGVRRR